MTITTCVESVSTIKNVIISEISPQLYLSDETTEAYYISPTVVNYAAGKTTLTFTETFDVDEFNGAVVLILNGNAVTKCYTIYDNTANDIVVYEDASTDITATTTYISVVHTAESLRTYCIAQSKVYITFACEKVTSIDGNSENPESMANHITYKISTGVYGQGVQLEGCTVWASSPRDRRRKMDKINYLMYQWSRLDANTAVYLVISYAETVGGVELYQNRNFNYQGAAASGISARGYLRGYPAQVSATDEYYSVFAFPFKEAWLEL